MELIKTFQSLHILRLSYGEELREQLEKFCADNNIGAAWINAIGATKELEIGVYNLKEKKYDTKVFSEMLEITSVIGDMSIKDGKPFLHAHGTFSRPSMEVVGGHIMRCVTSATLEILLNKIEGSMERQHDEFSGLHLLCKD
ncbi:MAG: hypothetical protein A3B96_04310 [Candidatus Spechtbacteria bacterium RIFCSPHIGHO2_02_FULL_43_15b]|uniref:PPC domain-containing protein n=1 Tax=Candidatus Spechtbacteria bacterium RIFCSPHIGHO2_01_FULL_43_30 TaxID=1802158 RepID=A0A1G2H919_9BACT|nr:MAG: hypothetical protein A2827_01875 [Candidatus Spechtbacteria bacterium RIFCSPHIGHO2_01_FULL_43_30]OGZ58558.1 MAG: hypothetical protein A3B96_04310 [Candidatus Spechtbacteria bacterium RIFCSPHIGHO2_02_FULL_43_15b]